MRRHDARRQALGNDDEAVILAADLDPPGRELLDWMVGAAMAERHLLRLAAERQREKLMAEADAENRRARFDDVADDRHGVFAGGGRIAGTVRQEDAVGLIAHDAVRVRRP